MLTASFTLSGPCMPPSAATIASITSTADTSHRKFVSSSLIIPLPAHHEEAQAEQTEGGGEIDNGKGIQGVGVSLRMLIIELHYTLRRTLFCPPLFALCPEAPACQPHPLPRRLLDRLGLGGKDSNHTKSKFQTTYHFQTTFS